MPHTELRVPADVSEISAAALAHKTYGGLLPLDFDIQDIIHNFQTDPCFLALAFSDFSQSYKFTAAVAFTFSMVSAHT